jgi:hypothetical protein
MDKKIDGQKGIASDRRALHAPINVKDEKNTSSLSPNPRICPFQSRESALNKLFGSTGGSSLFGRSVAYNSDR